MFFRAPERPCSRERAALAKPFWSVEDGFLTESTSNAPVSSTGGSYGYDYVHHCVYLPWLLRLGFSLFRPRHKSVMKYCSVCVGSSTVALSSL